jgi:membrane protein
MMIVIGAVFLASLIAAAVLSAVQHHLQGLIREGWVWWRANQIIPLILFILLFAMIFKILPDVSLRWRDVWFGATVTAILFLIGRYLIGLYIGMRGVASVYGAAGSLVALLTWLYYSALIFFFGAELTRAYARARGSRIEPDKHAVWIREEDVPAGDGQRKDKH